MKKRLVSSFMAFLMVCSLVMYLPTMNMKADAAGNIVIAGIDIGYARGSYFTKNGQSCATMASHWSNGRCHKNGVCDAVTSSYCNCMRYWPTGNPNNCQVDLLSSQCFGFARYCEWRVYGRHDGQNNSGFYTALGSTSASTCTASYLKEKIYGIAAAAHLRTGDGGHSISIVTTSDSGITWADCNSDGYCKVVYHSDSWSSFSEYIKRRSGISYINAYSNGIPSNTNPTPFVKPTVKDKYLSQISKDSFRVVCDINNPECVSSVRMATWTTSNQSDLAWRDALFNGYSSFFLDINRNDYREKPDVYITHIYIYDTQGGLSTEEIDFWPDYTPPIIENYGAKKISQDYFRVLASISDSDGISSVRIATWTTGDQRDLIWRDALHNGYGTYFVDIPYSDYRIKPEVYISHIYAYDSQGNSSCVEVLYKPTYEIIDSTNPEITDVQVADISSTGYTITCKVIDEGGSGLDRVQFPTWTSNNGQDDIKSSWETNSAASGIIDGDTVTYRVNVSDHKNEHGIYRTHIYAYDKHNNCTKYVVEDLDIPHSYKEETVPATCTTIGTKTYTCEICGDTYTEEIPATGHKFKDTVVAPTETAQGYTLHECENCDYSCKDTYTDVKPHNYTSIVTKEATCTEDGVRTYTCSDCGDSYTEAIPATGHSYTSKVVEPTCAEKGYTLHTCTKCGDTYKTDYTSEKGHKYSSSVTKDATCEEDGTLTSTCAECGDSYTTPIPATGHSYGSWRTSKNATCTEAGEQKRTCSNCYKSEKREIEAFGHDFSSVWTIDAEPTCTTPGSKSHHCSSCDEKENVTVIPATGHTYGEPTFIWTPNNTATAKFTCVHDDDAKTVTATVTTKTTEPTYTTAGKTVYTATVRFNGKTYTDTKTVAIAKLTLTHVPEVPATCTEAGNIEYWYDDTNEKYFSDTEGKNEITKAETVIKEKGHKFVDKTVAPTYDSQGYTEHTCSVCGYSYKDSYIPKKERTSIANATVTVSATSVYNGKALTPAVTVKLGSKTLTKNTDYTVTYKSNTNCCKATITITGKGAYTGTKTASFIIKPAKATLSSVKSPKTKQVKVTWKKSAGGVTGHEVLVATDKSFSKNKKTYTVSGAAKTSKTITKLKKGTKYFVKVRAYKTVSGTKYYGAWSAVKSVKCK